MRNVDTHTEISDFLMQTLFSWHVWSQSETMLRSLLKGVMKSLSQKKKSDIWETSEKFSFHSIVLLSSVGFRLHYFLSTVTVSDRMMQFWVLNYCCVMDYILLSNQSLLAIF